jgi:hypothetical protein
MTKKQLWSRWTVANTLSEMMGLGLTFAIRGCSSEPWGARFHREHPVFFPQPGSYELVCEFEMRPPLSQDNCISRKSVL